MYVTGELFTDNVGVPLFTVIEELAALVVRLSPPVLEAVRVMASAVVYWTAERVTELPPALIAPVLPVSVPVPEGAREMLVVRPTLAGLPLASWAWTVTEKFAPTAVLAGTLITASLVAVPVVKVTVAVWVTVTLSVVSVAVNTSAPAVADLTVNVTTPDASLGPDAALIVGLPGPEVFASVTVLPETGLLFASFNVTVIVEVVVPSAGTDVGNADTVDCAAVTAPGSTVNSPLTPVSLPPVVRVAVIVTAAPDLVSVMLSPARTPDVKSPDVNGVTVPPAPSPVSVKSTVLPAPLKLVTVLLFKSCAVIVGPVKAVPAVCVTGVVTAKWCNAPGFTSKVAVPILLGDPPVTMNVLLLPATVGVKAGKVFNTPAEKLADVPVAPAVPPKLTVPVNALGPLSQVLPLASFAVMLTKLPLTDVPAVAEAIVVGFITNWLIAPGLTVVIVVVPTIEPGLEVAVIVLVLPADVGVKAGKVVNTPAEKFTDVPLAPAVPPKVTVPVKALGPLSQMLPLASFAVMLTKLPLTDVPAVAEAIVAGFITNWLIGPGLIVNVSLAEPAYTGSLIVAVTA